MNDWHQIAKVYRAIDDAWVVYTFFISAIIICVTILLNVFLSFFLGGKFQSFPGAMIYTAHCINVSINPIICASF